MVKTYNSSQAHKTPVTVLCNFEKNLLICWVHFETKTVATTLGEMYWCASKESWIIK